jgi:hypothetical protein
MHDKVLTFLLVCIFLAGCGGLTRERVYRPLSPILPETQAELGEEGNSYWHLDLNDAELYILPVLLSSKVIWVFGPLIALPVFFLAEDVPEEGPLRIGVLVKVKPGSLVAFDTREFTVLLEDGRSLSPNAAALWRSESDKAEPVGLVTLSGEQTWRRYLLYGVPLSGLGPFTLQLGTLSVNGRAIQVPSISFVQGKAYSGD